MPFAVAHLLIPVLIMEFARRHSLAFKKAVTKNRLFICSIFGLLPDIDILISFITKTDIHRTFTHSLFIPLAIFVAACFLRRARMGLMFAGYGWLTHIALDATISGTIPIFYPVFTTQIGLHIVVESIKTAKDAVPVIGLDIFVLLLWVLYMVVFRPRRK